MINFQCLFVYYFTYDFVCVENKIDLVQILGRPCEKNN